MQILIVGTNTPAALERYCESALCKLGHTVRYHDLNELIVQRARFYQTPVLSEIEQAFLRRPFNRKLVQVVREWKPDVVLVIKGIELNAATLAEIRRLPDRPALVNWNPDSPFDDSPSNSSPELLKSIAEYDVYFIWDKALFKPLEEAGARQVAYLPFGYAPEAHYSIELSADDYVKLHNDVCFVGGYTPQRAAHLEALSEFDVGIWGTNWHFLDIDSPLRQCLRGGWTTGEDHLRVVKAAGIVMNFIRPQNGDAHNMRTFETPASGGFMLSTYTHDQANWLPEGEGAAYFRSAEDMREQVAYYLARAEERQRIAAEGYRRITTGKHSYGDRMQTLLDKVATL